MNTAIDKVVRQNNKFLERRDMLQEFVKLIPNMRNVSGFFRDVDRQIGDDDDNLASTVQRLLPVSIPFIVEVTDKSVTLSKLFRRTSLVKDPLFKHIATHITEAAAAGEAGVLLFKVKNNGTFVCHNLDLPMKRSNAIVVSAVKEGGTRLYIEPLKGFMCDVFEIEYEVED
jgi:hypothetical protein